MFRHVGEKTPDALHSEHGVYEELEAAHVDAACGAVLVELYGTEIVTEEPAHILEYAICGLEKVDPGEEVEYQVALHVVGLLEHVQLRVRLADKQGSAGAVGVVVRPAIRTREIQPRSRRCRLAVAATAAAIYHRRPSVHPSRRRQVSRDAT